ncbi:MAG: hypothetical protein ACT4P8_09070 [Betaproteobacteria bacterium]
MIRRWFQPWAPIAGTVDRPRKGEQSVQVATCPRSYAVTPG